MRITVSMPSTGLVYAPGLAQPITIEVDRLPKSTGDALRTLAARANIFGGTEPIDIAAPRTVRDARKLVIQVEDGGRQRILQVAEPLSGVEGPLREFIQMVRDEAHAARLTRPEK